MFMSLLCALWLPWWTIAIAGLVGILIMPLPPGKAFLAGFSAVFLLFFFTAIYFDTQNQGILSQRIGVLIQGASAVVLCLAGALIGGLACGLGALTGSLGLVNFSTRPLPSNSD